MKFEGCRVHRAYDSPWTKKALEYVTGTDVSFMFTGRVFIFENALTDEKALEEELPADVSRGRVPRVGPAPLWFQTRRSAFSEYVLRSDSFELTDEQEDKMVADVCETLDYFERNTYSIPYARLGKESLGFKALDRRADAMFAKKPKKTKYEKDMCKIHPDRHVKVIAKRTGEGPYGSTVEFVCEPATELASVPNYIKSVWRELQELYFTEHLGASMRTASYSWLDRARSAIAARSEVEKERAERMALYKEQMAERQAAASLRAKERMTAPSGVVLMMDSQEWTFGQSMRESVGTGGAPAPEKTPAPEHDSGDEEDDATDFAASNPFGALLVAEASSVAATKGGAAMVEPKKMAPKKMKSKGTRMAVDYGIVGSKGGRK